MWSDSKKLRFWCYQNLITVFSFPFESWMPLRIFGTSLNFSSKPIDSFQFVFIDISKSATFRTSFVKGLYEDLGLQRAHKLEYLSSA